MRTSRQVPLSGVSPPPSTIRFVKRTTRRMFFIQTFFYQILSLNRPSERCPTSDVESQNGATSVILTDRLARQNIRILHSSGEGCKGAAVWVEIPRSSQIVVSRGGGGHLSNFTHDPSDVAQATYNRRGSHLHTSNEGSTQRRRDVYTLAADMETSAHLTMLPEAGPGCQAPCR